MTKQVDTLIIGGGSIGVCVAYFLSIRGRHVTLIERSQIGGACSYGNAGLVAPSHIVPLAAPGALSQGLKWMFNPESPFYIKPRLNLALLLWLSRFMMACRRAPMLRSMSLLRKLTQASTALFEDFARMDTFPFHFKQKGSLTIYRNEANFERGVKEVELLKTYGVTYKVLEHVDLSHVEPRVHSDVVGGIYFPEDAHMNPSEFVTGLASVTDSAAVSFLTSTEVLRLKTSDDRISAVQTTRGDFEAEQVVLAAGTWSPSLVAELGLNFPIQPAKGYSITVRCGDREGAIPVALSESKVVVTQMGEILRFAGTLELSGLDSSIDQRRVYAIRRAVREYLVGLDDYELLEIWQGLRPLSPDGLPIIGRSKKWKNLTIATGHGMLGLALGPITGKVVAELLCDETPSIDVTSLGEDRFR